MVTDTVLIHTMFCFVFRKFWLQHSSASNLRVRHELISPCPGLGGNKSLLRKEVVVRLLFFRGFHSLQFTDKGLLHVLLNRLHANVYQVLDIHSSLREEVPSSSSERSQRDVSSATREGGLWNRDRENSYHGR